MRIPLHSSPVKSLLRIFQPPHPRFVTCPRLRKNRKRNVINFRVRWVKCGTPNTQSFLCGFSFDAVWENAITMPNFCIIYDSLGYTHYLFSVNLSINTLTKRTPTPTHSPAGIQTKDNKVIAEKNQPQWPTEWCGKKLNYIFKHCNANFPTD